MDILQRFTDPALCRSLIDKIYQELDSPLRFMEVCGTHTVSLFRSGLHSLLPEHIVHLSGPGCPVCVTHDSEVAMYLELAEQKNVILATFGDLIRVPGPDGRSLKQARAEGAKVSVVYSPLDALTLARENPNTMVVFLGIGFETTAPAVAATIQAAHKVGLQNFTVLSLHKLVPPALKALLTDPHLAVDALIMPGHVSTIVGLTPYRFIAEECNLPAVITGFEPLDILQSLYEIVSQRKAIKNGGRAAVVNHYTRAVQNEGNPKAIEVMKGVFVPTDALWRGIGSIAHSGLELAPAYVQFDAKKRLGLELKEVSPIKGCLCGDILRGKLPPYKCPLFGTACTPASPVGPCMVSTEGSCAAYYKYHTEL